MWITLTQNLKLSNTRSKLRMKNGDEEPEHLTSGLPCTISDRVPRQCDVTGNVQIIGLDEPPAAWAKRILDQHATYAGTDRASGADAVAHAGFDITSNAEWLQKFYLDALAKPARV